MIKHFGCWIVLRGCQDSRISYFCKQLRSVSFAFADDMVSWSKMIWRAGYFACSTGITISVLATRDRHEKRSSNKEYIYLYIVPATKRPPFGYSRK